MTLRHFRIFMAVVDCGTMHRAAQSLYLSQPGVSQAIRELEKHYQARLFERYKKKLILTAEGEKLLKHCRALLGEYDALEQAMKQTGEKPVIHVGATVSVSYTHLDVYKRQELRAGRHIVRLIWLTHLHMMPNIMYGY